MVALACWGELCLDTLTKTSVVPVDDASVIFFFSCLFLSLRDKKEKFKIRIIVCNCSSPQCESTLFRFVMSVVLFFLNYVSSALQLNVSENNKLTENTTYLMDHISV